ncbi:hypothetical protein CXB51_020877 [Gossypium anomalum]|uniref:Sugar phosphate transporter domain-containing protein n=1 Tax=Gossypium anomalum TaxID=47600 RepID=A0A8J5YKR6_9ROSI|nr:hypothetical protein CXB51_020877 [Gossypium anomalum]
MPEIIRFNPNKQHYGTTSLITGYALCSSLLAVINKFAITKFNYPALLTAFQYLTSSLGVWVLAKFNLLHHDPFKFPIAKKFFPAAIVFYLAIFANTNLLRHANVETSIVFRSLTPLLVAVADKAFRSNRGAVGYVVTDKGFTLVAELWAFVYSMTITVEMVYVKHMVMNLGLNTWGFVFYNNLLSLMIALFFWVLSGECGELFASASGGRDRFELVAFVAVCLSCFFGLLISFFGFAARKAISATAFTVTGVVNKFLTVLINVLIWDKHATPIGLVCLLFTLAAIRYQSETSSIGPGTTIRPNPPDDSAIAQKGRVSTRFTDAELWGSLSAVGHGTETGSISPRTSPLLNCYDQCLPLQLAWFAYFSLWQVGFFISSRSLNQNDRVRYSYLAN